MGESVEAKFPARKSARQSGDASQPHIGVARAELAVLFVLAAAAYILFETSPKSGDFWWSDAPRHALNGAFVLDLVRDFPLDNPKQYAVDYYVQYPALTILFYPPLLPTVMAAFYAVFGVSHFVAQLCVAVFGFFLAWGAYRLARFWLPRWRALSVGLLLVGAPEIALWGRQVMLDIPAYAWMVWSAVFFVRYLNEERPAFLYASNALLVFGLYTKLNLIFFAPVLAVALVAARGASLFRDRHAWVNAGLFVVALLPLAWMALEFGAANVESVVGGQRADLPRASVDAWVYYARQVPRQLGWVPVFLAPAFVAGCVLRRDWRLPRNVFVFLLLWFGIGYLFFSLVSIRVPRHDIFILLPVALFAVLFLDRVLGQERVLSGRLASPAALVLALGTFVYSIAAHPVRYVAGYAEAAEFVAAHAPPRDVMLFSGYRDGSFIFNLRAKGTRPDLTVLRADKLLLRVAIERRRGIEEKEYTEPEIAELLGKYGVHYVVAQEDFWTDLTPMARLQRVLRSERFEEVTTIRTAANFDQPDKVLKVYRNLGPVQERPARIELEILTIGRTVEGRVRTRDDDD